MFSLSSAALVGFGFSSLLAASLLPTAAARFASIQFSSVKQCGNFTVQFTGGKAPADLPLTLSVLPVNGTPVFIPLPTDAWNATTQTGAMITFLPFPEGTEFVASLDDARGRGTALVSDVLVIEPSDSDDTSCLPSASTLFVPRYSVQDTLKQCENFSVAYDVSQNFSSPTIRAFVPKGASFPVNESAAEDSAGLDSYLMDVPRDSLTVLLFSDQNGYHETSPILPILGDITSDTSCIPTNPLATAATLDTNDSSSPNEHVSPKLAIIVIAVCVGVIGLVATIMVVWYCCYRRKAKETGKFNKLDESPSAFPGDAEKQMRMGLATSQATTRSPTTSPLSPTDSAYAGMQQVVRDPPYIRMGSALNTPTYPDPRDPFGERSAGNLLGQLSARESLGIRLGATAVGNTANGSSTLALPRNPYGLEPSSVAYSPAMRSSGLRRSSTFDPATEFIPGASPYYGGRFAVTPDNSLASYQSSILRRVPSARLTARQSSLSSASVSTVEIDRILEMATIYGGSDMPDLPPPAPVMTAPATLRSSAYMAGRESRRQSAALSSPRDSPVHSRNNSEGGLSIRTGQSGGGTSLRQQRAFRSPPLAPLPSSPLGSPVRPSLDTDAIFARAMAASSGAQGETLTVPAPAQAALGRNVSSSTRQSWYSDDGLDDFAMLQPPPPRS